MKVHVHIDRRSAAPLRGEMDVANLRASVIEMIAVHVEKCVERDVEPLPCRDLRRGNPILPVDDDLNVFPVVFRSVVNREALAFELERLDFLRLRARKDQRETEKEGERETCRRSHTSFLP